MIADLLHRAEYIEKMGTGIAKIRKLVSESGLPAPKFEFNSFFTVVFERPVQMMGWVDGGVERWVEGLAENQAKILKLVHKRPAISKKELSKIIGIGATAIDKNIAALKKKGLLKRVGPDKGGHWEIIR